MGITDGVSICEGNTITLVTRAGGLIDGKSVALHDRVKILRTTSAHADHQLYETRTVDKIWGSALDVTMVSVKDAYTNTRNLQDLAAWVDESGTTEDLECSRRGLCDSESGLCACFPGYTSANCNTQN